MLQICLCPEIVSCISAERWKISLSMLLQSTLVTISVTRMGNLLDYGQLFKPLATIYWPKSPTFLGNSCEGVKIYHISSEIILRQLFWTFGDFLWSHW